MGHFDGVPVNRGLDMANEITLHQVNLVVSDMDAAASFYRRLGLDISDGGAPEWAPHHRTADTDGVDVDFDSAHFAAMWNSGWPGGTGVMIGFRVPERADVDRLHAELTADGHLSQQEPYDAFWGSRFAIVADPDGNSVGILSPPDDAHRSAPPSLAS